MSDDPLQTILDEVITAGDFAGGTTSTHSEPREVASCSNPYASYVPAPKWESGSNRGVGKVRYTHDAMIDLIIADPAVSQNVLAAHFGYTASWVSQILHSDAFQARLSERKAELIDPTITANAESKFQAIVSRSQELLLARLDQPASSLPDNLILRSLELSSRALGYGAKQEPQPQPAAEVHVHLESLSGGLVELLRRKRSSEPSILEGVSSDVQPTHAQAS